MHLVWDWNGTLLDDFSIVLEATNAALIDAGGKATTAEEHRRDFRRPITDYYAETLGFAVDAAMFAQMDHVFHATYRQALARVDLTRDARDAMAQWRGTQSLLSMWFHDELVPTVARFGLSFSRVDGRKEQEIGGGFKADSLRKHLAELGVDGVDVVLIGDTVDDAHAAAAVGAKCVLYSGGFTARSVLETAGVPVSDTLLGAVALAG